MIPLDSDVKQFSFGPKGQIRVCAQGPRGGRRTREYRDDDHSECHRCIHRRIFRRLPEQQRLEPATASHR